MKTASRFGGQMPGGIFPHVQNNNVPQHTSQYQSSNSTGLPPPSFNHAFSQGSPNANPFAPTGNMNGLAGGFGPGTGFGAGGTGLASREAQEGFAHGAALQQQAARDQMRRTSGVVSKIQQKSRIRDVWRGNLAQEMQLLRELVEKYPYISMDTEFPGIVARPMGAFTTRADYHYQTLRCNVDLLKVIQLGITLFSTEGELPPGHPAQDSGIPSYRTNILPRPCTWQFNFQFSLDEDMYNQDSIDFLITSGIDLEGHSKNGIDPSVFGSMLITSGLAFFEDVRWISFHSGYDFAYIVKLMICKELPDEETEYRKLLKLHFPAIYDIKYMIKHAQRLLSAPDSPLSPTATNILNSLGQKAGLQDLADELGVKRTGTAHQAGSDSLLTGKVFWAAKEKIFNSTLDDEKFLGQVWGLNQSAGSGGISGGGTSILSGGPSIYAPSNSTDQPPHASTPNLNGATIYNHTPQGNPQGTPGTPASSTAGTASTPNQSQSQEQGQGQGQGQVQGQGQGQGQGQVQGNRTAVGSLTPGGGGGVFGAFKAFGRG